MLENIFLNVLSVSLTTSAVIALIFLAGALIRRRYSVKWRYLAWILLAVRLAVPFTVQLPDQPIEITVPQREISWRAGESAPQPEPSPAEQMHAEFWSNHRAIRTLSPEGEPTIVLEPVFVPPPAEQTDYWRTLTLSQIAAIVWIAGAALILLWQVAQYLHFCRRIRKWQLPVEDDRLLDHLRRARWRLDLMRPLPVYLCPKVATPMIVGLRRPKLLLPTLDYSESEREAIFRHELTHCRRRDVWVKLLLSLVAAMHWFNPLVWWMGRAAERDIELSCDEAVVNGRGLEERAAYSEAILSAISRESSRRKRMTNRLAPAFSTAHNGDRKELKRRFANIFDMRRHRKGILSLVSVVLVISLCGGMVACGSGGVEQTNESLNIFCYDYDSYVQVKSFISSYRLQHPNVEIDIIEMPDVSVLSNPYAQGLYEEAEQKYAEDLPAIYQQVRSQLMARSGPDLLIFGRDELTGQMFFDDVYKAMSTGTFADLSPYLEADGDYDAGEYNQNVIQCGQYKGKQYVMPLFYSIQDVVALSDTLAETGFDFSKTSTLTGLMEEAVRYTKASNERKIFDRPGFLSRFPSYMGIPLIDYEKRTVDLKSEEFRRLQELYKELYENDRRANADPEAMRRSRVTENGDSILLTCEGLDYVFGYASALYGDTNQVPKLTPIRDVNGAIQGQIVMSAAINDVSPNKQNAYDFLRMLMDNHFQSGFKQYIPVWNYAVFDRIANAKEYYGEVLPINYYEEARDWPSQIKYVDFETGIPERLFGYFEPYYKGDKTYEECLKKAQRELEIYISE